MHHSQSPLGDGYYIQALEAMGAVSQDISTIHDNGRGARYCENQQPIRRVSRGMRETRSASFLDAGGGGVIGRDGRGGGVEGDSDVTTGSAVPMSGSVSCLPRGDREDVDLRGRGCDSVETSRHSRSPRSSRSSRSLRSGIIAMEDDSNQWLSEESWRHEDFFGSSRSASLLQAGKRRGTVERGSDESVDRVAAAYCSQGDVLGSTSTEPESSVDDCSKSRTVKGSGASERVSRDWLKDDIQHGGAVSVGESLSMEASHDVGADATMDVVNTGSCGKVGADAGTEAETDPKAGAHAVGDVKSNAGVETGAGVEADSDAAPAGFAPTAAHLGTPDAAVDLPNGTAALLETSSAEPSGEHRKAYRGSGPDADPGNSPSRADEMASDGRGDPLRKPPNEAANPELTPLKPPRDYEVRGWMALDIANGGSRDIDGKRAVVSFRSSSSSDNQGGKRGSVPMPNPSTSAKKKKERGYESEQEERVLRSGRRQRREFQQNRKQKQKQQSLQLENITTVEPSEQEGAGADDIAFLPKDEQNDPFVRDGDFSVTLESVDGRSVTDDDGSSSGDRTPRQEAGLDEDSEEDVLSGLELKTGSRLESESIGGFHVDEEEGLVDPADDDTDQSACEKEDLSLEDGSASSASTVATAHVFSRMEEIDAEFTSSENMPASPGEDNAAAEEITAASPETKTPEHQPLSEKTLQEPASLSEHVVMDVDEEEDGVTTGAADSPTCVGGGTGSGSSVEDNCAAEAEAESRGECEETLETERERNRVCERAAEEDQGNSDVYPDTPTTDCFPTDVKAVSCVNDGMAKSVQGSKESVEDDCSSPTLGDSVDVAVGLSMTIETGGITTRSFEDVGALSSEKDGEGEEEASAIPISDKCEVRAVGSSRSRAQNEVCLKEDMNSCTAKGSEEVSRRSTAEKDSNGGAVVTCPVDDRDSVLEGLDNPDDADTGGDVAVDNPHAATSGERVVEVGKTDASGNRRIVERSRASGDEKLVPEAVGEAQPVGDPTVEATRMVMVAEERKPPAGNCDTEDVCDGLPSLSTGDSSYNGVSCDNEDSEIDGVDHDGEDKNDPSPPDISEDSARDKEDSTVNDTVKDAMSATVRYADSTSSRDLSGGTGATVDAPSRTIATACRASPSLKDAKSAVDKSGEKLTRGAARRLAVVEEVKEDKPATAAGERGGEEREAIPVVSAAAISPPVSSGEEVPPPEENEAEGYTILLSDGCTRWDPFAGEETHRIAVWDSRRRVMIRGTSAPMRRSLRAFLLKGQYEVSLCPNSCIRW